VVSAPRYRAGECPGIYNLTLSVASAPGGFADISYTWHLAGGGTPGGQVTLKQGASQSYAMRESPNGTTNGSVYVTWTADGSSSESNSIPVELICLT